MEKDQLDNKIESFMTRKMKQFPDIDRKYRLKNQTKTRKPRLQPQVWLLSLGTN